MILSHNSVQLGLQVLKVIKSYFLVRVLISIISFVNYLGFKSLVSWLCKRVM